MDEYKLTARFYDLLLYPVLHPLRKKAVEIASFYSPTTIIDICCGTGNQLKYLKRSGFKNITGVDLSDAMLKQTRKGKEPVKCYLEDASEMSFDKDHFDLGIISFALHEKPESTAHKIVAEAFRVIRPGGILIVIDFMVDKTVKPITRTAISFVERMAGKEHYRHFKNYHQYGGLDALLPATEMKKEYRFHSGGTRLRIYKINHDPSSMH